MATGPVATAAGPVTPAPRFYDINGSSRCAAGGTAYDLPPGLSKFAFTGRQFGTAGRPRPSTGICTCRLPRTSSSASAAGATTMPILQRGGPDYQAANGRPYEQRQYLFHLKGAGGFRTLLVPRRKGAKAPAVTQDGETFKVAMQGGTGGLSADGYTYVGADKAVATAFGDAAVMADKGLSVEGGPTEVA